MNLSLISKILRKYPVLVVSGLIIPLSLVLLTMRTPKTEFYQEEQIRLEKRWHDIQTNLERSDSLTEDIANINTGLEKVQSRLMNVESVASNYEFFYGLERDSGVKLDRCSLGLASDGSELPIGKDNMVHFSVIPCEISMTGSIREILRFVDLLDRQEFVVRLDLMNVVNPDSSGNISDTLNAQMRCYVLALKNE